MTASSSPKLYVGYGYMFTTIHINEEIENNEKCLNKLRPQMYNSSNFWQGGKTGVTQGNKFLTSKYLYRPCFFVAD